MQSAHIGRLLKNGLFFMFTIFIGARPPFSVTHFHLLDLAVKPADIRKSASPAVPAEPEHLTEGADCMLVSHEICVQDTFKHLKAKVLEATGAIATVVRKKNRVSKSQFCSF